LGVRRQRGGQGQDKGEGTAVHGVDPEAVKKKPERALRIRAGCVVALQGFEPRTCGL
jgi:hypothetical protein